MISGCFILSLLGCFDVLFETSFDKFEWEVSNATEELTGRQNVAIFPSTCVKDQNSVIFIFIKSAIGHTKNREIIRKTWGKRRKVGDWEIIPIFVTGSPSEGLTDEAHKFNDMLVLKTTDSYRNNTYKFIQSIWYSGDEFPGCTAPSFSLLIDDDYFLNVPALVEHVSGLDKNDQRFEGYVFDSSPFRFRLHKHQISLEEYPFSRYPKYVTAGAILISNGSIKRLGTMARKLKYFPFDDIYAGILAKLTKVGVVHNEKFTYWQQDVSLEAWRRGDFIAVHGFSPDEIKTIYGKLFPE